MPDLHCPRLVVFDFDGTLADTWRDIATALNRTLRDAGLPKVEGSEVRFWIGEGVVRLLEQALPELARSPKRAAELYERFRAHYERCCMETTECYPGIIGALEELAELPLVVASNKPSGFLDRMIDELGLKGCFRAVVGGDSLPFKKPDARVVEHLIERLGGPRPERIFVVGDSAIDVETGRAVDARTIGCAWGLRGGAELRTAGVDHLIEHPDQIAPLVYGRTR